MKKIRTFILSTFMVLGLAITPAALVGSNVGAAPCTNPKDCIQGGANASTPAGGGARTSLEDRIATIVNILLFILGAIAVIMIVVGGIRYTLSNGDSSAITSAKNTILYAVIGLVVALLAYAIVGFVLDQF